MPTIHLEINDEDEFTSCEYCKRHVQPYNNTSLSTTAIHNVYTKTLLSYQYLNCQKCGVHLEIHPTNPNEEGLVFVCPNNIPHQHALCYDCGLLYDLKTDTKKTNILSQLQYNHATQAQPTQIQSQTPSNNVLASNANFPSSMEMVSNGTLIAELMSEMMETEENTQSMNNSDGLPLFLGTIMALLVWFGIYMTSPQLFRLSGCAVWFSIFYFVTNIFFTENEPVQKAVFSLFGFLPVLAAIYIFEKTRKLNDGQLLADIQLSVQFVCIFGCVVYLSLYFTPIQMYLFWTNEFVSLTIWEQIISVFIAVSLSSFVLILCKNCNFVTSAFAECETKMDKCLDLEISADTDTIVNSTEIVKKHKPKRKRRRRKKKRVE